MYGQLILFCPITLLQVVLGRNNQGYFKIHIIICLQRCFLVKLLAHVIYAVLGCYNPPKWCSISCYNSKDRYEQSESNKNSKASKVNCKR